MVAAYRAGSCSFQLRIRAAAWGSYFMKPSYQSAQVPKLGF